MEDNIGNQKKSKQPPIDYGQPVKTTVDEDFGEKDAEGKVIPGSGYGHPETEDDDQDDLF